MGGEGGFIRENLLRIKKYEMNLSQKMHSMTKRLNLIELLFWWKVSNCKGTFRVFKEILLGVFRLNYL